MRLVARDVERTALRVAHERYAGVLRKMPDTGEVDAGAVATSRSDRGRSGGVGLITAHYVNKSRTEPKYATLAAGPLGLSTSPASWVARHLNVPPSAFLRPRYSSTPVWFPQPQAIRYRAGIKG